MRSSINTFLFFSFLVLSFDPKSMHPLQLSSSSESFELRSLPLGYLKFLGDSHLQHSDIALTKERKQTNAVRSAGVALYRHSVFFLGPHMKKVPSFYTMFTFAIDNLYEDGEASGDGLAFLLSPNDNLLGSPGYLGLVDSTDLTRNEFIAIEFDTKCDSMFHDPDDNHVGLDINSLLSVRLATTSIDLKSGDLIHSWIDYKGDEKRLEVFLSYSKLKPKKPLLKVDIDLSHYLKENIFVGFSAATNGSRQLTRIERWEFTIAGLSPPPSPSPPESGITFLNPSESVHRHRDLSKFAIGLTVGVCFVPFIVLFVWFCWIKLMEMIQKSEGKNNLEMQTIRSSGGISRQDNQISFLVDEVGRVVNIQKVLDSEADLILVKTVKSSILFCDRLATVKPGILPICNGPPLRTNDITSV